MFCESELAKEECSENAFAVLPQSVARAKDGKGAKRGGGVRIDCPRALPVQRTAKELGEEAGCGSAEMSIQQVRYVETEVTFLRGKRVEDNVAGGADIDVATVMHPATYAQRRMQDRCSECVSRCRCFKCKDATGDWRAFARASIVAWSARASAPKRMTIKCARDFSAAAFPVQKS
ncbi:hypothetical protein Efla_005069 [Eimeria flavescens]